jgi:hypothetical protein
MASSIFNWKLYGDMFLWRCVKTTDFLLLLFDSEIGFYGCFQNACEPFNIPSTSAKILPDLVDERFSGNVSFDSRNLFTAPTPPINLSLHIINQTRHNYSTNGEDIPLPEL